MNKPKPDQTGIPILQRKTALEFLDGDEELLDEMLELFQEETPPLLSELKLSVSQMDWVAATRHAHTLKGMAGQVGAARMQSSALVLETLLRGDFEAEEVVLPLARVEKNAEEVLSLLRSGDRQ